MTDLSPESPIVNIRGNLVALGPVSRDMVPQFQRWINDFGSQLRVGFQMPAPVTAEFEEQWYDSISTGSERNTFVIRELGTMAVIGSTGLHGIDLRHRCATFGIMIGDPDARGKGYGTEAATLMLDYGFTVLGLHSIDLTVAGFNLAGQKAYAKAGFRECGRIRERIQFAGQWWDQIRMDCLAHEFESPVLARAIAPD
ncbi:MAG: GNAT family N-acetyltransferase [Chloroflexota bacterium]|nr:GNAT family N-acetyltransferase [Chloroflexota bacterium]